jgi:Uma2 family endonuclease
MTTASKLQTENRLSFEAYLQYDDGTDVLYELVLGELQPMSLGTGKHGKIIKFLDDAFNQAIAQAAQPWTSQRVSIGIQSPRGNRWDTCRIPDVMVLPIVQWDEMEERESVIRAHEAPPLVVVEVVSPSTIAADYRTKRAEYAVLDIPEYWIVDSIEGKVTICVLEDGAYTDRVFQAGDSIVSSTFPGLDLSVEQILQM